MSRGQRLLSSKMILKIAKDGLVDQFEPLFPKRYLSEIVLVAITNNVELRNAKYNNSQGTLVLGFCLKFLNQISLMRQENLWIAALVDNTNLVKYQDCYFGLPFLCLT
jgi:hypothetical protein